MTSTETTDTDISPAVASPVRGDVQMLYVGSKMPRYDGFAAIYGNREGMLDVADLPACPEGDDGWPGWLAKVHRILTDRGVLAAWGRHLVATTRAADCPWWCQQDHGLVVSESDMSGIFHERLLTTITFDGADTLNRGETVRIALQAVSEGGGAPTPMGISSDDVPDQLSVSDAVELIGALQMAVEMARTIQQADRDAGVSTNGDTTAQVLAEQNAVADQ